MNNEILDIYLSLMNGQMEQAKKQCFDSCVEPSELAQCVDPSVSIEKVIQLAYDYGRAEERDWLITQEGVGA